MSMSVIKEPRTEQRELELVRIAHFSDAVFAVSIVLLILDIKLPEIPDAVPVADYLTYLRPMSMQALVFLATFIFMVNFWRRHLQLFRLLHHQDNGLVTRNLFFLFFIITFPFAARAMVHITPHFILPLFIYLCNLAGCLAAMFWMAYYAFQKKPSLTAPGHYTEKEIMYQRYKYNFLTMATGFTVISMVYFFFPDNVHYQYLSYWIIPALALFNHFRLKIKKRNTLRAVHIVDKQL